MKVKIFHLKIGWSNERFSQELQSLLDKSESSGYDYYDIKISSKDNNCLLILKKRGE